MAPWLVILTNVQFDINCVSSLFVNKDYRISLEQMQTTKTPCLDAEWGSLYSNSPRQNHSHYYNT